MQEGENYLKKIILKEKEKADMAHFNDVTNEIIAHKNNIKKLEQEITDIFNNRIRKDKTIVEQSYEIQEKIQREKEAILEIERGFSKNKEN